MIELSTLSVAGPAISVRPAGSSPSTSAGFALAMGEAAAASAPLAGTSLPVGVVAVERPVLAADGMILPEEAAPPALPSDAALAAPVPPLAVRGPDAAGASPVMADAGGQAPSLVVAIGVAASAAPAIATMVAEAAPDVPPPAHMGTGDRLVHRAPLEPRQRVPAKPSTATSARVRHDTTRDENASKASDASTSPILSAVDPLVTGTPLLASVDGLIVPERLDLTSPPAPAVPHALPDEHSIGDVPQFQRAIAGEVGRPVTRMPGAIAEPGGARAPLPDIQAGAAVRQPSSVREQTPVPGRPLAALPLPDDATEPVDEPQAIPGLGGAPTAPPANAAGVHLNSFTLASGTDAPRSTEASAPVTPRDLGPAPEAASHPTPATLAEPIDDTAGRIAAQGPRASSLAVARNVGTNDAVAPAPLATAAARAPRQVPLPASASVATSAARPFDAVAPLVSENRSFVGETIARQRSPAVVPVTLPVAPLAPGSSSFVAAPIMADGETPVIAVAPGVVDAPTPVGDSPRPMVPVATAGSALAAQAQVPQPVTLPAAQAFAAAMFAAERPEQRMRPDDATGDVAAFPLAGLGGAAPALTIAVAAPPQNQGAPLDLTRDAWMGAMIDRIETLRDSADTGVRETRMRLTPDALGSVDVQIRHDHDGVHVRIVAESAAARTILAEAAPRLTELAEARGLKLGGANVDAGTGTGTGAHSGERGGGDQNRAAPTRPVSAFAASDRDERATTDTRLA